MWRLILGVAVGLYSGSVVAAAKREWVLVTMPHFTLLTEASEADARKWATELERFRRRMQDVLDVPESMVRPLTVVLFRSDKAMRPFKPLENGQPKNLAGMFVNACDSHAIALSLDGDPKETRRIIFHEAVHWYSNAAESAMPAWLEEGVAEVYSTFEVNKDGTSSIGRPLQEHLALMRKETLWGMRQLSGITTSSLKFNEGDRATQFYAESWLATHFLLFGKGTPGQNSVRSYLVAQATAPNLQQAFRSAFGMDYGEFDRRVAAYLMSGSYTLHRYRPKSDVVTKDVPTRLASEAELELALASLLLGARRESTAEVEARLQRASVLAPENPHVWQRRGEAAFLGKHYDAAADYFTKALAAGSKSYFTYYGLATSRLQQRDGDATFSDPSLVAKSMDDLRQAVRLNPRHVPSYESLAGLIFVAKEYDPADRTLLETGARISPESTAIDVGLAACDLKAGKRSDGRKRLGWVLETGHDVRADVRKLAIDILHSDDWDVFSSEIGSLFAARRYREAVARIDAERERFPEVELRSTMDLNRSAAAGFAEINEAIALANSGKAAAARAILQRLLASEGGNERVMAEARRVTQEMDSGKQKR